ncbi:MAG: hypothetical protein WCY12_00375 [Candidatus Omnitrophota bacterium]|jgi:hypothetical protein
MAKIKKGAKLMCVPCGREVMVTNAGISEAIIWCCKKPMKKKTSSKAKKATHRKKKK